MQLYARFLKYIYICQIPFISDYGLFFFFPPSQILKILETTNRIGSTPHPSSCFFLPGPKAPRRDTEHSLDCHSGRRSQGSASTAKLQSHIISQLLTSGKLGRQYLQKQFCNDHTGEIPKECL